MTRKQMIELMESAYLETQCIEMIDMTHSQRMEYILSKMEQAGILPPKIQFTMGDKEVVDYTWEKQ
jgi:hypothetical protein